MPCIILSIDVVIPTFFVEISRVYDDSQRAVGILYDGEFCVVHGPLAAKEISLSYRKAPRTAIHIDFVLDGVGEE